MSTHPVAARALATRAIAKPLSQRKIAPGTCRTRNRTYRSTPARSWAVTSACRAREPMDQAPPRLPASLHVVAWLFVLSGLLVRWCVLTSLLSGKPNVPRLRQLRQRKRAHLFGHCCARRAAALLASASPARVAGGGSGSGCGDGPVGTAEQGVGCVAVRMALLGRLRWGGSAAWIAASVSLVVGQGPPYGDWACWRSGAGPRTCSDATCPAPASAPAPPP